MALKPSDSSPVTVTVAPESSTTLITIPVFDPSTGNETGNTPSSFVYGTPAAVRVDVGNASAKTTFPPQLVCAPLTCPTGNITLSDSVNGASATLLSPSGGFPLGSGGYVLDYNTGVLPGGTHQLSASYPGDSSYKTSAGTYTLTVTPAPTQLSIFYVPAGAIVGTPVNVYATFNAVNSFPGAGPTGTIAFYDGAVQIPGTVTYSNSQPGSVNFPASLTGFLSATFTTVGSHQITAKYSGDPNYGAATSSVATISLLYSTSESGTANPTTVNLGQTANLTAIVTGASTTLPMTGTFQFFLSNGVIPSGTVTQGTDANGNQTLTATVTATPQYSQGVTANYSGDANYTSNSATIFVNVNIPDFSLPSPSSPLLITAGMPGSMPITVAPLSNIASAVSMSCQGNLPVGYTCSLSPTTVNLSNGVNGTTTLSLNPSAPAVNAMSFRESIAHLAADAPSAPENVKRGSLIAGLALLLLLLWPARRLGKRWKLGIATACVFCFIVGCGGSSSAGGGPPIPLPTTTTVMSSASKVASQASVTFTATITGSASSAPTGTVIFLLNGGFAGSAAPVGNSATLMTQIPTPGIYALSAQYSGDALNQPSTAIAQNVLVTGSTLVTIQGQTSNLTHFANVTVTLQ